MRQEELKELLIQRFEHDPLYKLALINKLDMYLFTEPILSMHPDTTYSTVDCGNIINRADSTIRNYFRSDLLEYIQPEKFGKLYRLNYQSIFKLHLIFLLIEKAGKGTVDLLVELGMQPAISKGNYNRLRPTINHEEGIEVKNNITLESLEERIEDFEQMTKRILINDLLNERKMDILFLTNEIYQVENELQNIQNKIEKIEHEAQIKYLEEKQSAILTASLKKNIQKPSLLSVIKNSFSKDGSEDMLVPLTQETTDKLYNKIKKSIDEQTENDRKEIDKLNSRLAELQNELTGKKNDLVKLKQNPQLLLNSITK